MKPSNNENFVAIILAAGASQRMGQDKASLPWLHGKTLLEWMAESLSQNGWKPVVVLGPHNHQDWIGRLCVATLVLNSRASEGKTTSLATGAQALPERVHSIMLTAVDQPRPPALYRLLRESAVQRAEPIIVPENGRRRGHPIVLKNILRERLTHLNEEALGLRELLNEHVASVHRLPCEPDWLRWDCNTPVAYKEALRWFECHSDSHHKRNSAVGDQP